MDKCEKINAITNKVNALIKDFDRYHNEISSNEVRDWLANDDNTVGFFFSAMCRDFT